MHPYATDRVRVRQDGLIELEARLPKDGWRGRVEKRPRNHPGTAVSWDDEIYEVLAVEALPRGVRYTLAPWLDEHAIRVLLPYDAASESERERQHQRARRQRRLTLATVLLGALTGHLPGPVQREFAHEFGISAPGLTMMSTAPQWLLAAWLTHLAMAPTLAGQAPPIRLVLLAGALLADGLFRFGMAFAASRPVGSVAGVLAYGLFYLLHPRRHTLVHPFDNDGLTRAAGGGELSHADRLAMVEPLLTLLSVQDQRLLERAHGYDYRRCAKGTALFLLLVTVAGAVTAVGALRVTPRLSALTSLVTASVIGFEQMVRLASLGQRPASSLLRFLVRPFLRRLF